MTPPRAATAAATLTATALILTAGCASGGHDAAQGNAAQVDSAQGGSAQGDSVQGSAAHDTAPEPEATQQARITSTADPGFFDPCTDDMLAWFADRGLPKAQYIEPEKDDSASGCTFGNHHYSVAVMTQLSTPGDATDQWVHEMLEVEGDVKPVEIASHEAEMSINRVRDARQDCHVLVTIPFGFLNIFGGPHGTPASPPPRDCDKARSIAAAVLAKMDE